MLDFKGEGYTKTSMKTLYTILANAWMGVTSQCNNDCKKCNNYLPCQDINNVMDNIESVLRTNS